MLRRRLTAGALLFSALTLAGVCAPLARAQVLRLGGGHFVGVTFARGAAPSSLPAAARALTAGTLATTATSAGQLASSGGAVVHASSPYVILWTPSGHSLPAGTQSLLSRYFTDVAADSGKSGNVYGVGRQYTDATGFADYRQSFSSSQVIVDTNGYPTTGRCSATSGSYSTCLTDTQLETEIARQISTRHLPTDGPSGSEALPVQAPIYFIVLPTDVNVCSTWQGVTSCASSAFCAYHSWFTSGSANVLYATIPTLVTGAGQNPKVCQWDNNSAVQEPNGSAADVALKYLSHEDNETLTDPFGDAWIDPVTGNEDGDNCNAYGPVNPASGTSPNAFAPALGGSPAGSLYNQLINGDPYYLQSEWSNGDGACELQGTGAALSASFSAPTATVPPGASLTFDPSASTTAAGLSSATWNFGDGSSDFVLGSQGLSAVNHSYPADGTYTVTLTLVDTRGDLATLSHVVHVDEPPTAVFTVTTSTPGSGQPTAFDASASSDPDGTIAGYAWNFGDGSLPGSGVKPTHIYQAAGTYQVTLTVTDSGGQTATTVQTVTVVGPTVSFSWPSAVEGSPVQFDGTAGDTAGAAISTETWIFGDGTTVPGPLQTSHTYAQHGSYFVTLIVTDAKGYSSSYTQQITVADEPPVATFGVTTTSPGSGQPTAFDATSSYDSDGSIVSYAWDFGDGSTGTGAAPSHVYATPGTYAVALTVTDSDGDTATTSQTVSVAGPVAQFSAPAPQLEGTQLTFTAASQPQVSYVWNFGDGQTASGQSTTHAYTAPGSYAVTLTLTDANNNSSSVTHPVTVLDEPPLAAFSTLTRLPSTQQPVTFDGTASSDADGAVTGYAWSFGDGTYGSGASPSHKYTAPGTYTVSLTVTDSDGQTSAPVSHQMVVYGTPTAAFAIAGNGATEGQPVSFNAAGSSDAGVGGPIVSCAWNFGDGTSTTGPTAAHAFAHSGSYAVTLTVTNSVGLSDSLTEFVTIGDEPPRPVISGGAARALTGQRISFDGGASSDPDGQIRGYDWSFGDGTSSNAQRPVHAYRAAGRYTVSLTVVGSAGERATATTAVVVVAPAHISRVQVTHGVGLPTLLISATGPGRLRVGAHTLTVRRPGATRVRLQITRGQLQALNRHRIVRLRLALTFIPAAGPASHQTLTITLRLPTNSRRYAVAMRARR